MSAQVECPNCKGVGKAWQWRSYGDQQYHGDYYEKCDRCDGAGKLLDEQPRADLAGMVA